MMHSISLAARYIAGKTIRQIANEMKLPTQMVLQEIYTSNEFVSWVFSKPGNDDEFLNRYLEVFTNNRVRDCTILGIGVVRYNHIKHALITNGELKAPREGIYTAAQIKALEKFINQPEGRRNGEHLRVMKRTKLYALYDAVKRATGVKVTEYRKSVGLSKGKLIQDTGANKSIVNNLIRHGLITLPYTDEMIESVLRVGLAMHSNTNRAAPRWRELIGDIRDIARYKYISAPYLYSLLPATPNGIRYHIRHLPVRVRLYPEQNSFHAYDREAVAQIVGNWLGTKYRWAVRQVDGDWLPLKCKWYDWKTS
jgi:hypothetical protein